MFQNMFEMDLAWEDSEFPCSPQKNWSNCTGAQGSWTHHYFLFKMCLMESEHDNCVAEKKWRCHCQLMYPNCFYEEHDPENLLHWSLQWFNWRHFCFRQISMHYLFCNQKKKWKNCVCFLFFWKGKVLFWSILLLQWYINWHRYQWIFLLIIEELNQAQCADTWSYVSLHTKVQNVN